MANRQSTVGSLTFVPRDASLAVSYTQAGVAVSWELDLRGRLRRLSEAARAQYLASEEGRRGVTVSLIAEVAGDYFTLRELDLELQIGEDTRRIAEDDLRLVNLRHQRGAATGLDVHQAQQLLYTATAQIAGTQRAIGQAEDALSLLLGQPPGSISRGMAINDLVLPTQIPPGLPSSLLERRPDIRQVEQGLIAANARIGVAKSYYYPQITLTGFMLGQSRALSELFTLPARFWNATAAIVAPLFSGGALRANVQLTEAQKREMVIAYQKTIYNAFREVSDALVSYDRTREQLRQQELLVNALRETVQLSTLRYQGGLDSYLQVLDSERSLFQGQISLARLRLQELQAYVQVYRALGGGW